MNVADLVRAMEAIAPTRLAAAWDNVGLLVGDPTLHIARALLTIDCTRGVLDEAVRGSFGAIVTYHPPIFEAQKRFVVGSIAYEAARAGVALYSPHTALDAIPGGTNDALADVTGMTDRAPLVAIAPEDAALAGCGFGRVGPIPRTTVLALIERVKVSLGLTHALAAGALDREVTRAAVCAGSGGDLLPRAIDAGAQVFLTGELRHHDALRAAAAQVAVVCTLHSAGERPVLASLERRLAQSLPDIEFARSTEDREPFVIA
jgi:dinuclear metal center YbgI/SA1388 family protein